MPENNEAFIILSPGFAASEDDSTCLPMQQELVKAIKLLYPHLSIFILCFQYPYHTRRYKWNDIDIIPFNGRNRGGIHRLLLRARVKRVMEQLRKKYAVRGMLSFWLGECAYVGKRFGDQYGIRHYCWLLGQDARPGNKYVQRVCAGAGELLAISDSLQAEYEKNYGVRPHLVLTPGVVASAITERERDIHLLGVGSMIPLKQFDWFVEMVVALRGAYPQIKAVLIGEGPQKEVFIKMAADVGLKENIDFTGALSHASVFGYMQRARILVHPSTYEGFSGVCMEAISAGAHVVSFCQPMRTDIMHWHIVKDREEMLKMVESLLSVPLDHRPVVSYRIDDTADRIMQLYY